MEAPPELKWGTRGAWCPRMPQSRPTSGASKTSLWSPDASHYHTSVPAGGSQTIVLLSENPISQESKRDPQNKKSKMRLGRLRKEANDPGKKKNAHNDDGPSKGTERNWTSTQEPKLERFTKQKEKVALDDNAE